MSAPVGNPEPASRRCFPNLGTALLVFAALAIVTVLTYSPALSGGLLWDDDGHLTRPDLRSVAGLVRIWTSLGATQQYYPLLHSAFWLEWQVFGDHLVAYHLTTVLLHVLNAFVVCCLLRRLAIPGAFLAAALFALHPVAVESVAWISEQKNTLSLAFYLLSALAYLKFDETRSRRAYALAALAFVGALLTKTVTATLPVALAIVLWWRHRRLRWTEDLLPLLPGCVVGAGFGLFTAWVERAYVGASGGDFALTLAQRVLLAGRISLFYAEKIVWPSGLSFIYPRWDVPAGEPSAAWLLLGLLVTAVLYLLRHRARGVFAGWLFYLTALVPVSGFFNVYPFRFSFVADHFAYIAMLGLLVPLAAGIDALLRPRNSGLRAAFCVTTLVILLIMTRREAAAYADAERLYRTTLARNPSAWLAHVNLGNLQLKRSPDATEAAGHFRAALRIRPDAPEAHLGLATVLERSGDIPGAIAELQSAVRADPRFAPARNNLGCLLLDENRDPARGIAELRTAVAIDPTFAVAHANLAKSLARLPGHDDEALREIRTSLRLQPTLAGAYVTLGTLLARSASDPEAVSAFQTALRLDPSLYEAHYNLGLRYLKTQGRLPDAAAEFDATLRLRPDFEPARRSRALVTQILEAQREVAGRKL